MSQDLIRKDLRIFIVMLVDRAGNTATKLPRTSTIRGTCDLPFEDCMVSLNKASVVRMKNRPELFLEHFLAGKMQYFLNDQICIPRAFLLRNSGRRVILATRASLLPYRISYPRRHFKKVLTFCS